MSQAGQARTQPASAVAEDAARDTKQRLLDAAERLFGERGFEGASLRAVTQAAGTSVSAANYHFGSKEALLRATLLRRVAPVNRRRLERLDALELAAGNAPIPLEKLLEVFLRPLFEERDARGESPVRFVAARLYADPPDLVNALKQELFGEVSRRFLDALARTLPAKPRAELALAFQFVVGVMVHVMAGHLESAPQLDEASRPATLLDDESLLRRMRDFAAAGLRAVPEASR